jgi:hypothetical protein
LTLRSNGGTAFTGPYDVQPGEVFVVGDDRGVSVDSRAWRDGRGAGVPVAALEARAQWFLAGTRRDAGPDFSRMLQALPTASVHVEGLDTRDLDAGIARCLRDRPKVTRPPTGT